MNFANSFIRKNFVTFCYKFITGYALLWDKILPNIFEKFYKIKEVKKKLKNTTSSDFCLTKPLYIL